MSSEGVGAMEEFIVGQPMELTWPAVIPSLRNYNLLFWSIILISQLVLVTSI
jgi:hypothetical protein